MKTSHLVTASAGIIAICASAGSLQATTSVGPGGTGVAAGNSSLIQTYDYADSFTTGQSGSYRAGADIFPVSATDARVESRYGNPSRTWDVQWSLNQTKSNTLTSRYPGETGAGSATGVTQSGSAGETNWGFQYGSLRNNVLVQYDGVQLTDRMNLTLKGAGTTGIDDGSGLSVFIRDQTIYGSRSIGIFRAGLGEFNPVFTSGIALPDTWNNYAAQFDFATKRISIYTNEVLRGVIDLSTVTTGMQSGSWANLSYSTEFVTYGGATGGLGLERDRLWTDNFQIGQAIPEPSSAALLLGGAGLLFGRRRSAAIKDSRSHFVS